MLRHALAKVLVAAGTVGALVACRGANSGRAELPAQAATIAAAVPVAAVVVKRQQMMPVIRVTGTTEAVRDADLGPKLTSRIERVFVHEGQKVAKGQALVQLDANDSRLRAAQFTAQATAAAAQARQAEADYARLAPLAENGTIADQRKQQLEAQRDALKSAAEAAQTATDQAQRDLHETTVRAPFAGIISVAYVEAGEIATMMPPTKLVRLVDLSSVNIRVEVPERDLALLRVGDKATAKIPSLSRSTAGEITYIRPEINVATRSAQVVIRLPNRDSSLRAGMFAEVELYPSTKRTSITVPASAVGMAGDKRFVYVVQNGTAERQWVEVAPVDESQVEVVSGLRENQHVVTSGLARLASGVAVKEQ